MYPIDDLPLWPFDSNIKSRLSNPALSVHRCLLLSNILLWMPLANTRQPSYSFMYVLLYASFTVLIIILSLHDLGTWWYGLRLGASSSDVQQGPWVEPCQMGLTSRVCQDRVNTMSFEPLPLLHFNVIRPTQPVTANSGMKMPSWHIHSTIYHPDISCPVC